MHVTNRFISVMTVAAWGTLLTSAPPGRCATASTTGIRVTESGQAHAVIITPAPPGDSTQWAATELQRYLRLLSGVEVPILADGSTPSEGDDRASILVGGPDQNHLVKRAVDAGLTGFTGLKSDGFVLKTYHLGKRPVVVAGGNNDTATMYAVFELVSRLGVTFLLTGDIVPQPRSTLTIPPLDVRMEPALAQRGFLMEASHHPSITMLGIDAYSHMIDQMAKMKDNYLMIWWFAYSPFLKFSYHGEEKVIGDISGESSAYLNSQYAGGGSQTTDDVTIGKHWYPGRRMVPPEMHNVKTTEEAYTAAQTLMQKVIHYGKSRHVNIWLVDEFGALPPNLARYAEKVDDQVFEGVYGTDVNPVDPVNREMQAISLKAMIDTYPEAAGYFLNFPEPYWSVNKEKHHEFFSQQAPVFKELRPLMVPWQDRLRVGRQEMFDSDVGYFDLFKYLMGKRDEFAPSAKLGLMTVGRGYVLPLFDKMLPKDIPFATFDTGGECGYGTPLGMPMSYFAGMGERQRVDTPYLDHDCDMLGMQFNVGTYIHIDHIFPDGVKQGLTGVAPWMSEPRGTEQNSSFLAQAAWNPQMTLEEFYKGYAEHLFGVAAAPDMYQAFITLEQNQVYRTGETQGFGSEPDPTTLTCCGALPEAGVAHEYSFQKNPFDGPSGRRWEAFIESAPAVIDIYQGEIAYLDKALASMHAAESKVEPQGKHELSYLMIRTEAYRDGMQAEITEHQAFMAFDKAFGMRATVSHDQFVAQLETSMKLFAEAHQQARVATEKYAEMIDYPSDLETLYHLNAGTVMAFDLITQWMQKVVDYHEGKPYTQHVPFERLFPQDNIQFAQ